jgi:GNAT superfamily N-acetyltransferase
MDDAGFRAFRDRAIARRAERWTARGIWRADRALEASRKDYAETFSQGRETPNQNFLDVVEASTGAVVGEAWYRARESGGKIEFWIMWISIWPEHRRKGYGAELLGLLEEEARRLGAERTLLDVWADNPGAFALYTKVGYVLSSRTLVKDVRTTGEPPVAP